MHKQTHEQRLSVALRDGHIPLNMSQINSPYRIITVLTEPRVPTAFGRLLKGRFQAVEMVCFVALITAVKIKE